MYSMLYSFGVFLIVSYVVYFIMLLYKALDTIKHQKKTYRFTLGVTIFTIAFSSAMMM